MRYVDEGQRTMGTMPVGRYRQNSAAEKVLGAVYTPPRVATALVRWAVRSPADRVLDPACGDGVFLAAAQERLADLGSEHPIIVGVDVDPQAAAASGAIHSDFFEWSQSSLFQTPPRFDAIVGNPPFIRSHLFPEGSRQLAFRQMREMGLHPSRLMSTWAPFVAVGCRLLSETGRLALVVPEELLHVGYADELRRFLLSRFRRVVVCLSDGDLFPSVQQSVVLLLCDQDQDGPGGLLTMAFSCLEQGPPYTADPAPTWDWCPKWTHLFLSPTERQVVIDSFRQLAWKRFREYGRVEVGVVTGSNDFFILSRDEAAALGDGSHLAPIVTSARDLPGIHLSAEDFLRQAEQGRPSFLIHTSEPVENLPLPLREYLASGVKQKVHLHFKCRNREPWYAVPSVWPADALLLRQAGEVPKLVHLSKKCTSTDTLHRVRWRQPELGKRHVVSFLNTWTLIACELTGRSYGGGVLELMPGEANSIPLPPPLDDLEALFEDVDTLVRSRRFDTATEAIDRVVTPDSITASQHSEAREVLAKLIMRRRTKHNGHG
jgi:adenine-specific DNA-methyltransferase